MYRVLYPWTPRGYFATLLVPSSVSTRNILLEKSHNKKSFLPYCFTIISLRVIPLRGGVSITEEGSDVSSIVLFPFFFFFSIIYEFTEEKNPPLINAILATRGARNRSH